MLLLIAIAMVLLGWITARCVSLGQLDGAYPEMRLAIRAGMLFLIASGILGFAITFLGYQNIRFGISHELVPPKGVLKFPHGAALHAIQVLAMVAWLSHRISSRHGVLAVWFAVVAHAMWLAYALLQTFSGRDRLDANAVGWLLILGMVVSMLGTLWALLLGGQGTSQKRNWAS
jgi:hypothetical protein